MTRFITRRPGFKHMPEVHRHIERQQCINKRIASNIIRKEDGFDIELALPGIDKKNVNIYIEKNILTVESKSTIEEPKRNYKMKQFSFNNFCRRFELPENTDSEKVEAVYENGILTLGLTYENIPEIRKEIKIK